MDAIKDLANALSRYDVRDIEIITNKNLADDKESNRYREFYLGLRENKWSDEDEIAAHFNYESRGDKGFRRLKEGLIDRLMNSILYVDLSGKSFTDFHRKVQEMYKLWLVSENLHRRGAITSYFEVGEKALALAIETEIIPAVIELSRGLKVFYAIRPSYFKDFTRLSGIFDQYWPLYLAEMEAQNDFLSLISNLSIKKGYKKEFAQQAAMMFQKYEKQIGIYPNILFNVYARLIQLYTCTLQHDWEGGNAVADLGIAFLKKNESRNREYIFLFSTQKASCLMMMQQYEEANKVLDSIVDWIPEGKTSWFKNREIATVNAFYAENYALAWQIVSDIIKHPGFNTINEIDQETWRLYNGFLFFLHKSGRLTVSEISASKHTNFRVAKWLNEMPIYSQDKRGGNIPLLLLQLHFLILESHNSPDAYDEVFNRAEALRKYASRNLDKSSEHFRTDCFLSLIQLLVKHWHDPKALEMAEKPVLERMNTVSSDLLDTSFETEIVPYERQWKWMREVVHKI